LCQTEPAALVVKDSLKSNDIDPLTPAKAAFTLLFYLVWVKTTKNIGKSRLFTVL
jgi:hypothetical protein